MGVLEEIAAASSHIGERVGASVVAIGRGGRGSGVVIGGGKVLTNAHNLRDRTTTVTFADGRSVQGSVAGIDMEGDLVVLDVDTDGAPPVEWAPQEVTTGSVVFALANPGARGVRTTFGTVTAAGQTFRGPRGRRITGAFEHTAPLSRGSSGGPVVDSEGRLLGVNTSRVGEGFYLAVAATDDLRRRVDSLTRGESPERPRLGVGLAPSYVARRLRAAVGLPDRDGLLVQHVEADSAAARAELARGDLLVEANGKPLASADDLLEVMEGLGADATLTLRALRGTEERDVSVRFDRPATQTGSV
jgi:serine protease Do